MGVSCPSTWIGARRQATQISIAREPQPVSAPHRKHSPRKTGSCCHLQSGAAIKCICMTSTTSNSPQCMGVHLQCLPLHARAALHEHSYRIKSLFQGWVTGDSPAQSCDVQPLHAQGPPADAGAGPKQWPGAAACPTLPPHLTARKEFMSLNSTVSSAPRHQK